MPTSFSICFVPVSVPETDSCEPSRQRAAQRDDVAVLVAVVVDEQAHLDAALLGEQRRVHVRHGLAHDVREEALERGELEHADVVAS